jgi:hypothetical protein
MQSKTLFNWWVSLAASGSILLSEGAQADCLRKPATLSGGTKVSVLFIAKKSDVPMYLAKGFERRACPTDMTAYRNLVERVCAAPGSNGQRGPINTMTLVGRSPADACASARAGLAEAGG